MPHVWLVCETWGTWAFSHELDFFVLTFGASSLRSLNSESSLSKTIVQSSRLLLFTQRDCITVNI